MLKYIYWIAIYGLLGIWALEPVSQAGPPERVAAGKLDKSQESLEELNRQLHQAQKKQKAAATRERSILKQLQASDQQMQLKRQELPAIEEKITLRDHEIQDTRRQLDSLQTVLSRQRLLVGDRIKSMYKEGKAPYFKVLMASEDYHDFVKRYVYLQYVIKKETDLLGNYETSIRDLEEKSQKLEELKTGLVQYQTQLKGKLNEISTEKRKKGTLLARIRDEKHTYEQTIEELESSSRELQTLIRNLEKERNRARRKEQSLPRDGGSRGLARVRGHLNWPVDGVLVSRFGLQKHPKFDTYVYRKGIEIGAKQGGSIYSVYEGEVVYADWFPGYGMVIILDHGENYYSLYAHLAKLLVSVGDDIRGDQVIGEIGDTGVSEGNRLYFELRRGEKPMDPLSWLKAKP